MSILRQITNLFHRSKLDQEIEAELRSHLDLEAEEQRSAGLDSEEASYAARRALGNTRRIREDVRSMWFSQWPGELLQDLRFGLRMLRKSPGFTAVAILTLALGIGANAAIFSVVNAVLLRPLPYPKPAQLVQFELQGRDGTFLPDINVPEFEFYRDHARSFQAVAGWQSGSSLNLGTKDTFDSLSSLSVTDDFFRVLGVHPILGREFLRDETRPGAPLFVILSNGTWRGIFGSDPRIIGRQIEMNDQAYTVVGVLPRGFIFTEAPADIYLPLHLGNSLGDLGTNTPVIGRLKDGVALSQAQANGSVVFAQMRRQGLARNGEADVHFQNYQQSLVASSKPAILMLFGAVALLLLIACANVASLFLARAGARRSEICIRTALGASRSRLLRQLLTESLLVAALGALAGLFAGVWALRVLISSLPFDLHSPESIRLGGSVLACTLLIAIATTVAFGLASFMHARRVNLHSALGASGSRSGPAASRGLASRFLVVAEVALSVALLVGAGLLIDSLYRLHQQSLGFDPHNVTAMYTPFTRAQLQDPAGSSSFERDVLANIHKIPGVVSAAVVTVAPLMGQSNAPTELEGHPEQSIGGMEFRGVSPEYFQTMRVRILRGREFTPQDSATSTPVALVNQTLAQRWWSGKNPLGDRILFGTYNGRQYFKDPPREVVGVVGDVKGTLLGSPAPPTIYLPALQFPGGFTGQTGWVVRASGSANIASALRRAVAEVNPEQQVENLTSMSTVVSQAAGSTGSMALLMGVFAALALVLTAIGIYGVLAFYVAERTREIGIRLALGAARHDVLKLVLGRGMVLAVVGVTIGIAASLELARFIESQLYQVKARDPWVLCAVAGMLLLVALAACWTPTRRAMRVDPVIALRSE